METRPLVGVTGFSPAGTRVRNDPLAAGAPRMS
jgi:hypothetical protein